MLRYHLPDQREITMSESTTSTFFSKFATTIADWSGRPATFVLAAIFVLA